MPSTFSTAYTLHMVEEDIGRPLRKDEVKFATDIIQDFQDQESSVVMKDVQRRVDRLFAQGDLMLADIMNVTAQECKEQLRMLQPQHDVGVGHDGTIFAKEDEAEIDFDTTWKVEDEFSNTGEEAGE